MERTSDGERVGGMDGESEWWRKIQKGRDGENNGERERGASRKEEGRDIERDNDRDGHRRKEERGTDMEKTVRNWLRI